MKKATARKPAPAVRSLSPARLTGVVGGATKPVDGPMPQTREHVLL